jgi:hypothetical protein
MNITSTCKQDFYYCGRSTTHSKLDHFFCRVITQQSNCSRWHPSNHCSIQIFCGWTNLRSFEDVVPTASVMCHYGVNEWLCSVNFEGLRTKRSRPLLKYWYEETEENPENPQLGKSLPDRDRTGHLLNANQNVIFWACLLGEVLYETKPHDLLILRYRCNL